MLGSIRVFFSSPKLWWKFEGRYIHYNLMNGISNLIKWFPLIWKDRNYDSAYILDLLKFKLNNQAESMIKRDFHTSSQYYGKQIKLCANLVDKIKEQYYVMEHFDYYESKMEFKPIEGSDNFTIEFTHIKDDLDTYIAKYPLIYKRLLNNGTVNDGSTDSKLDISREIGRINHERAKNILFTTMKENIENWWD